MRKCLLVVDAQKAMFHNKGAIYNQDLVISNINLLIDKFKNNGDTICFVQHYTETESLFSKNSLYFDIDDSIDYNSEKVVEKKTCSSFYETDLNNFLIKNEITEIYVVGFQTEYCIDTTVRHGFCLGYKITLISDAHSTENQSYLSAEKIIEHHNNILNSFAKVISTSEYMKEG